MKTYTPRALTDAELTDVGMFNCTMGNGALEYREDTKVLANHLGVCIYATEDAAVHVTEMGVVTICDTLDEAILIGGW